MRFPSKREHNVYIYYKKILYKEKNLSLVRKSGSTVTKKEFDRL